MLGERAAPALARSPARPLESAASTPRWFSDQTLYEQTDKDLEKGKCALVGTRRGKLESRRMSSGGFNKKHLTTAAVLVD